MKRRHLALLALALSCAGPEPKKPKPTQAVAFDRGKLRLVIEASADDGFHFELGPADRPFDPTTRIFTSPMVVSQSGRFDLVVRGRTVESQGLTAEVAENLCVAVSRRGRRLARLCPSKGPGGNPALAVAPYPDSRAAVNAYGLGQACIEPGLSGGDWSGRVRNPGSELGNRMEKFDGGACGNTQIPVVFALTAPPEPFALFVDEPRAQTWDLRRRPWRITAVAPALRFYFLGADSLPALRADYLALTGRPPVPPRAAFGLWVSEYGYDDWKELDEILAGLMKRGFPVAGFVLDLQWFGGIREGSEETSMGKLEFDTSRFPDPKGKIASLRERGIGIIPIEESYIGRALPEHARLAKDGFLVATRAGQPVYLAAEPWWGKGGMIDWSNPQAADAWHDWKRQPLIDLGVVGHWTDLGEPEQYDPAALYRGFPGVGRDQPAVHNLYNLAWAESIGRGYRRHQVARRPFILTRSGTAGIQRTGAALWSGDLGSRFTTLAAQQRNRVHMVMSGVDYYGSDVGGFQRAALGEPEKNQVDDLYTRWLAGAALTEVPVRPHTMNLEEKYETSPDRVGHLESNLAAVRLRALLIPYLYSLAHLAHEKGEPVFPPLFFYDPADQIARAIGDQTLIGRDLLAAMAIEPGQKSRRVYLPRGIWYHFHDGTRIDSPGRWLDDVPLEKAGLLRLPLYARAGAVIPIARGDHLAARVFSGAKGAFELIEDDGETIEYLTGAIRRTAIQQDGRAIEIAAARGLHRGAPSARTVWLEVVGVTASKITADGGELTRRDDVAALEESGEGWTQDGAMVVIALSAKPVTETRRVAITN